MPSDLAPATAEPPLIVLSHLRWTGVWQRPQQVISRVGRGREVWFVEAPLQAEVARARLRSEDLDGPHRVWLELPGAPGEVPPETSSAAWAAYLGPLEEVLGAAARGADAWLYTPMALPVARALRPRLTVYDVMDDLAAFADGGPALGAMQMEALQAADLAFTGGRSLHEMATAVRGPLATHLFPSGVETAHFARSRALREASGSRDVPVAGFVGVLDERLDRDLLAGVAATLPDWRFEMVGPVVKIDPADLPTAPNITYPGKQPYARLPEIMAGFDVALMPFALNEATRSISPTKTLEYLAAGLPVVSTRVPDVVADWGDVVWLADTATEFPDACRLAIEEPASLRDARLATRLHRYEWDWISGQMRRLLEEAVRGPGPDLADAPAS